MRLRPLIFLFLSIAAAVWFVFNLLRADADASPTIAYLLIGISVIAAICFAFDLYYPAVYGLVLKPTRPGVYPVHFTFHHWISNEVLGHMTTQVTVV